MPDPKLSAAALSSKLHGLDHLRALAIILVFFFHYFILSHGQPEWLPQVASFGWTGVDLFFVLSGFLISSQLFTLISKGEPVSFPHFFIKRFFRIIPAFWCTVAIYFCIPFFREKEALPPLWKFLTFTQNIELDLKKYGTFSHAWSLCVEEHFYLFLPLSLLLLLKLHYFKRSCWLIVLFMVAGFALRIYSFDHLYLPHIDADDSWVYWYKYIYYPTWNRLDGLLAGVALAGFVHFYPRRWQALSRYGNYLLLFGLGLLTAAWFLCEEPQSYGASVWGFPLVAAGFGSMVAGAISPGSILYRRRSRITTGVANLSYAIYLTHKGVIHITHECLAGLELNSNIVLLICMVTCTAAALLLHVIVEKPFMKLRDYLLRGKNDTPPPLASPDPAATVSNS